MGGVDPERNRWQQLPDIDTLTQIRANQDPEWITIVLRCMGEMEGDQDIPPDPTRSWIDLSSETDEHQQRRAYVNLVSTAADGPMLVIEVRDDDAEEEPGDHRHMSAL